MKGSPRLRNGTRSSGTVVEWFDDRGYGFIADAAGEQLFFHISAVREHYARARVGDSVTFTIGPGRDGRRAANDVAVAGVNPRSREAELRGLDRPFARESYRVYGAVLLIIVLMGGVITDRLPIWFAGVYLVLGAISAWLYADDKKKAEANAWRTPEAQLHLVDLCGGIIGGLLAQHIMRHKTAKVRFIVVTAGIAVLHLMVLLALAAGSVSPAAIAAMLRAVLNAFGDG